MIYFQDDTVTLHHGDVLDVLRELPDCSVDSVVTDPPYGISFMGKQWDQPGQFGSTVKNGTPSPHRRGPDRELKPISAGGAMEAGRYDLSPSAMKNFQNWCEAWATECLRILKPGGYIVSFGGSRTWHRLASAIEDSGFEIRDSIAWLYGSGFPKSVDVAKAITGTQLGYGSNSGAIRRATMGSDYVESGRQGNRDGAGRRDTGLLDQELELTSDALPWQGWGTALKPGFEPIVVGRKPLAGTVPANVLEHGTGALNIDGCRIDGRERTEYGLSSATRSYGTTYGAPSAAADFDSSKGRWPTNVLLDESQAGALDAQSGVSTSRASTGKQTAKHGTSALGDFKGRPDAAAGHSDTGGASRFFPTFRYEAKAPTSERPVVNGVQHPTVKPLALMRWLVRLVTPPNGVVLEPFAGSGTTAEACIHERMRCIAIERDDDYLPLIVKRITKPIELGFDFGGASCG
ncbi:site-specific DNA-methyltransferase [Rhodococcus sp. 05-2255-2A2]|uniref:DNA-methyltransferase n=1 Tax=unclassified Rhodococcus (in: high G+C Gram-positive bacteria) TaxID=192944 RepID=UPI000B9BA052|nr:MULTISPECIES: site-specific DNA-methyltransferase [unclassified Rhodococcus (in: high G+C Gram-positive bacteria)]OZE03871.1 site-specific DNA-methyltransferase [Rhodococcus sp. 05-2255-3C]OZE17024.1 site-specific DNA-methyltransferase [Rhodococcus sp. 05-2255-2A2]